MSRGGALLGGRPRLAPRAGLQAQDTKRVNAEGNASRVTIGPPARHPGEEPL
jgi:hypothetical protein